MDPGVAAAFHASSAVSRKCLIPLLALLRSLMLTNIIVQNGVAVNMLKVGSKRRRPTAEVKEERRESDKKEMELQLSLIHI